MTEENKIELIEEKESYSEIVNIKKEDLYNFNMYLAGMHKNFGLLVGGTFIFGIGVWGLINDGPEALLVNIVICLLGLMSYFFVFVVSKLMVKRKIKALKLEDMPPVEITLSDEGVLYKFENEENNQGHTFYPFSWKEVLKCVMNKDYLFIHMIDRRTVLLVTLRDIKSKNFLDYLEKKLQENQKTIIKKEK